MSAAFKVYAFGHVIETYEYEYQSVDTIERQNKGGRKKEGKEARKEEYKSRAAHVAREMIKRLVLENFDENSFFLTLTYKENIQDRDYSNSEFKKFVQRIKRQYPDFEYIAVIEYQERGAIHYHMICNHLKLEWKNDKELKKLENAFSERYWNSNGWVDIQRLYNVDNVGAYLIKYLAKDRQKGYEFSKRNYLCSRGLKKPVIHSDPIAVMNSVSDWIPSYTSSYDSVYNGKVIYREYNLKRSGVYGDI